MNLLRRIIGTSTTDEISSIPSGKLFLTRSPTSPKGAFECIYNDAYSLIRKTTTSNLYQFWVTRVYQEGEDTQSSGFDDSDDDESDSHNITHNLTTNKDEYKFSITEELNFCVFEKPDGCMCISWRDLNGDLGDEFEFVIDQEIKHQEIDTFILNLYKCLYENKYQQSSLGISDSQLKKEFTIDPKTRHQVLDLNELQKSFPYSSDEIDQHTSESDDDFYDAIVGNSKFEPIGTIIYNYVDFSLHLFDIESGTFKIQADLPNVQLKIYDLGNWEFTLFISEINSKSVKPIQINATITQNMSPTFNYQHHSFIFNNYVVGESNELSGYSWLIKFPDFEHLQEFQTIFMQKMWESLHKTKYSINKTDEDYIADSLKQIDLDDDDEDVRDEINELSKDEDDDAEEEDEEKDIMNVIESRIRGKSNNKSTPVINLDDEYGDDDQDREERLFQSTRDKNSGLAVGSANDRTYVVRGDKLGVFGTDSDSGLDFKTSISTMKDLQGKKFIPKKTLLHQEDQYMIMSNDDQSNALYKMDLNRGKIIEEWKIDDNNPVVSFGPNTKYSQITNEQTLTGIHSNGLFKIDPRLSGSKLVNDNTYKSYKTKNNNFLTFSTTEQGYIALGSEKGDIRLYDKLGANAKTALPSLGDPIIGIDVSTDGRWVLATCKTYLLLIDVKIGGANKNSGSLGYNKYFDKDKKPTPRRLAIKPEHAAYITTKTGKVLNFTTAHFNTGLNAKESTIVTSLGPYIISWSLKKVLQGETDSYTVKEYGSTVVADNFKFGSNNDVIYALQDDVSMINRKKLDKANKVLSKTSRNSVVKPY